MRVLSVFAAVGALGKVVYEESLRTTTEADYWEQWMDYIREEVLEFENFAHHNERFNIFMDNIDKINRHNAQGLSWQMGVTPFAHLTEEEFKEQIVGGCTLNERVSDENEVFLPTDDVPDSIDWVAQGKVTPVKNQGQCGSCWAFSTTGSVEARSAIATGTLNSLSEQELVDCGAEEGSHGCNGGLMDFGFQYVIDQNGLCSEDSFPYSAKTDVSECTEKRSACGAREDPIKSFTDVPKKNADQLKAAIAQGPVSIAIEADQSAFQLYKSGVLTGRCGGKLDHGVLAVGYGNDAQYGDFWKVKNSWGEKWGENGYIRMCRNCGKDFGKGQCGILGQPSYPNV